MLNIISFHHSEKIPRGTKRHFWNCICDCGNKKIIGINGLYGKTVSCGCYHYEVIRRPKKKNKFETIDNYVVGVTDKGEKFYFDLEDYQKIVKNNHYWFIEDGYVRTRHIETGIRYRTSMHRLIMNVKEGTYIDHINRQRNDNRKINLRIANKNQNAMNSKIPINNSSGYKGVCWNKLNNNWHSEITVLGKCINLGSYKNLKKAINIRKQAEKNYFKEFAPQRHLFKEYKIK